MTAAGAARPWSEVLPHLTAWELECRRRGGAAADRMRPWGARLRSALPPALAGLWPFSAGDAWEVRAVLEKPDTPPRELTLDEFPLRIGRAGGCALQLPDPAVSSEHAEVQVEQGRAFVMDLCSTNGTRRNGEALSPLTPVELTAGDRLDIGPFALVVDRICRAGVDAAAIEVRASGPRLRGRDEAFGGAHAADRWARVRWAGETAFVKVSAPWMRAAWRRGGEGGEDGAGVSPLEEGAAQFVLTEVARRLEDRIDAPVELGGWLSPAEAARVFGGEAVWLEYEVWVRAVATEAPVTVLVPAGEPLPAAGLAVWGSLEWPASVCLGQLSVSARAWNRVETGDALVPDWWWAGTRLPARGEWGEAWLRVGSTWHGGRFRPSEAGAKLHLDSTWRSAPGGERPMSDEETGPPPATLGTSDLELLVTVELDRFPVTLAELQTWRPGEIVNLRRTPSDTVRLVVETGAQRRVLAEGRVVAVGDRLGVEVVRLLTRLEDEPGSA
jgi:flagellar motor switch/type III secretory pathway protein FliN